MHYAIPDLPPMLFHSPSTRQYRWWIQNFQRRNEFFRWLYVLAYFRWTNVRRDAAESDDWAPQSEVSQRSFYRKVIFKLPQAALANFQNNDWQCAWIPIYLPVPLSVLRRKTSWIKWRIGETHSCCSSTASDQEFQEDHRPGLAAGVHA